MRKGNKIKSVGVFINVKLQEYVIQFLDDSNLYIGGYWNVLPSSGSTTTNDLGKVPYSQKSANLA